MAVHHKMLPMEGFRHEAVLYAGDGEFIERMCSFVRDGIAASEPVLVAVPGRKIQPLRDALGDDADGVLFTDMAELGRNPGRIISAWSDFIQQHAPAGGRVRGIGEPIWSTRSPEELVESQRHEALLNLAFVGSPAWILCPYDIDTLDPSVIEEAYATHPFVSQGGVETNSATYRTAGDVFDLPLPEPPAADVYRTLVGRLGAARRFIADHAAAFGLGEQRSTDLVLAANEVISNSVRYGGGEPVLRVWQQGSSLVVEVRDRGRIEQPLVGRTRPNDGEEGGFGLWLVNQLCDLVQIRTFPDGSVVRLHMARD